MTSKSKTLGLRELINRVKQDLLSEQLQDDPAIFSIDEVLLELNFSISGDIESGFDLGIVTLGSEINEQRVQKITLKMTPLIQREQLLKKLKIEQKIDIAENTKGVIGVVLD